MGSPSSRIPRTFRDLSDKEVAGIESGPWTLTRRGMSRDIGWDDVLKSGRILIISEAGVGKTFECRACRDRLWTNGEPAFFLELAVLAGEEVRQMLDAAEQDRFDAWLRAQSETATFFLDSIDELKISQGSFEQALKRLSRALAGNLARARVVITTRPIPIDQQLVERHLPIPPATNTAATAEAFANVAMSRKGRPKESDQELKLWRNVGLMPLSREQIRDFAAAQGVTNPDDLLADIERRDAEEYAQRPQDLIELCSDWKEHKHIRSHGDQVESNVANKLKPRTDRPEKAQLSFERASDGASRLALAAMLTRKLTIRHSAESDKVQSSEAALDVSRVLTDLSQNELAALLERPLFGFANYGRVRFHHRSVVEYLSAKRLDALLHRGVPIKAIKRLLFAETIQGNKVVRPSLRPVAAWLSIWHEGIFIEVKEREPEVLINHGDPQSLRPPQRAQILRAYVDRYGGGGWRGLHVPTIQVHRFASTDLSPHVKSLWTAGIENGEVREFILDLIGAGKLADCADIPHSVVVNAEALDRERICASDPLIAVDDSRLTQLATAVETDGALWPPSLRRSALLRMSPKHLMVSQLCSILQGVKDPERAI